MMLDKTFWKDKKVLITGHTGFKGSWLSLWLQTMGAHVVGYALQPPTEPSLFEVARVAEGMTSITGDVRDLEHLQSVINEHKPEIVFHMAAQTLVRFSYKDPIETYSTNIMGTAHILETVRQAQGVRVVVCITSDKCYQNNEWVWGYRENDPVGGHDPYSSSKGAAELIVAAYRDSYFSPNAFERHQVAIASTRAGNVIGGGDWAGDRLIPDIMRAIMAGESVFIRSPGAVRPWLHVLEPLSGYLVLAEQLWQHGAEYSQPWNFGPATVDAKTVGWIAEHLTRFWGEDASWETGTAEHPFENRYLKLDYSKAASYLGWTSKLTIHTTLEWIVEWFKAYQQNEDLRALTIEQIERYASLEIKDNSE
ncbi:MAG: CDP-glucose 4,6-dehydratase [Chloroflexi bacterium]|nr:CDP-glucose 4,6-dehydratase [Chloroflexota bacterium]